MGSLLEHLEKSILAALANFCRLGNTMLKGILWEVAIPMVRMGRAQPSK